MYKAPIVIFTARRLFQWCRNLVLETFSVILQVTLSTCNLSLESPPPPANYSFLHLLVIQSNVALKKLKKIQLALVITRISPKHFHRTTNI